MGRNQGRQLWLLGLLLTALAAILLFNRDGSTPVPANGAARRTGADLRRADAEPVVDPVRLDALAMPRPEPGAGARNPFRFRPTAPPAPPPRQLAFAARPNDSPGDVPIVPAGPPPPPPIALKFIGIVDRAPGLRLAVLSDGRNVFYGREGETIEGRYRIERIGIESIDMAHVDGRGRQTIRLSGS